MSFRVNILLLVYFSLGSQVHAQTHEVKSQFRKKVNELSKQYKLAGFIKYKGEDLVMKRRTEFPIFVDLHEGRWYQFCVVGDPDATKFELKLAKAEVGSIITDKYKNKKTNTYWTDFSFVCPRSGRYLLTFYQRGRRKNLLGHVTILQKPRTTEEGQTITYSIK